MAQEATLGESVLFQHAEGSYLAAIVTRPHAGGRACLCVFHPVEGPAVRSSVSLGSHVGEWCHCGEGELPAEPAAVEETAEAAPDVTSPESPPDDVVNDDAEPVDETPDPVDKPSE